MIWVNAIPHMANVVKNHFFWNDPNVLLIRNAMSKIRFAHVSQMTIAVCLFCAKPNPTS